VTYHVQTEDKGIETPLVLSLVFEGGTILAAKRSPYEDLLEGGLDEKVLEERIQRQHKLICAAVAAGRLEDLKKLTAKPAAAVEPDVSVGIPMPGGTPVWDIPDIQRTEVAASTPDPSALEVPMIELGSESVLEGFGTMSPESPDKLRLKIFGSEKFIAGERRNLNVLVCKGEDDASVAGAGVMIKILGSDFRPLIYHAKADSNGIATVIVKVPSFRSGRAAILIRASAGNEQAELRRVITHDV